MDQKLITARLVTATMKRYDAKKEEIGTRGDAIKNSVARAKLQTAERDLTQACENYEKSGCQP